MDKIVLFPVHQERSNALIKKTISDQIVLPFQVKDPKELKGNKTRMLTSRAQKVNGSKDKVSFRGDIHCYKIYTLIWLYNNKDDNIHKSEALKR